MSEQFPERSWLQRVRVRQATSEEVALSVLTDSPLAMIYDMDALAQRIRAGTLNLNRVEDLLYDILHAQADTVREEALDSASRRLPNAAPPEFSDANERFDQPLMDSWVATLKTLEKDFSDKVETLLDRDALERGTLRAISGSASAERFVAFLKTYLPTNALSKEAQAAYETDYAEAAGPKRLLAASLETLSEDITYAMDDAMRAAFAAPGAMRG
jgi:hypothetical protein